jgi:hypothetical protein
LLDDVLDSKVKAAIAAIAPPGSTAPMDTSDATASGANLGAFVAALNPQLPKNSPSPSVGSGQNTKKKAQTVHTSKPNKNNNHGRTAQNTQWSANQKGESKKTSKQRKYGGVNQNSQWS